MDEDLVLQLLRALETRGVRYVVVGAVALNIHGLARATADLDLFVEPSAENVRALQAALNDVFEDPNVNEISAVDLQGDYPAIQYVPPTGDAQNAVHYEEGYGATARSGRRGPPEGTIWHRGRLMGIRKFKSVEEQDPNAMWLDRSDPTLWRRIGAVWRLSRRLCERSYPPGVYKNRTIEEANRRQEAWEKQNSPTRPA